MNSSSESGEMFPDDTAEELVDIVSEQLAFFFTTAIATRFFNGLLCAIGLLGNTITILVLVRHGLKDTTNFLLMIIAFCDAVYLAGDFFSELHRVLKRISMRRFADTELALQKYGLRTSNIFLLFGIFLVAIIAVERMVAVLFPFTVSRIFTPGIVKLLAAFVFIYVFAFSSPNFFVVQETDMLTEDVAELEKKIQFWMNFSNISLYLVPMVVILTSNVTIGVKLRLLSARRTSVRTSSKRQKEMKLFKMLFVLCCVTFVTFSSRIVLSLLISSSDTIQSYFRTINGVLYHVYTSSNFVIYVTMSSKFAATFKEVLTGKF